VVLGSDWGRGAPGKTEGRLDSNEFAVPTGRPRLEGEGPRWPWLKSERKRLGWRPRTYNVVQKIRPKERISAIQRR
jgi:hypothetical protein